MSRPAQKLLGVVGSLIRLSLALALVNLCWQDWPTMQARQGFEDLPAYDAATEASELFKQNRYSEALLLVDEALEQNPKDARLLVMRQGIETERTSLMRRLASGGRGALTGQGTDIPSMTGAIVADLFVFGDVRDLVIQGGHWLKGEETDDLLVALSAGGILLTVSPSVDLGAAILKLARRMGALSDAFAKTLADAARRAYKSGRAEPITAVTDDIARLSVRTTPSGTIALLKHVDDPAMLRRITTLAETPVGRHALMLEPDTTLRWLKSGWAPAETWVLKAATKGRKGLRYLAENSTMMFRMHPMLGLLKGIYKGNIPDLLVQLAREWAMPILGLAAGWLLFEGLLLLSRLLALVALLPRPGSLRR